MVNFTKRAQTIGAMSTAELIGLHRYHVIRTCLVIVMAVLALIATVIIVLIAKHYPEETPLSKRPCTWLMHEKRVMEIECTGGRCSDTGAEWLVDLQEEIINRCDTTGALQNGWTS